MNINTYRACIFIATFLINQQLATLIFIFYRCSTYIRVINQHLHTHVNTCNQLAMYSRCNHIHTNVASHTCTQVSSNSMQIASQGGLQQWILSALHGLTGDAVKLKRQSSDLLATDGPSSRYNDVAISYVTTHANHTIRDLPKLCQCGMFIQYRSVIEIIQ